jgi:hypothetical protein
MLGNAGRQSVDGFNIAVEGCRAESDNFRSFFQGRDFGFDLQALRLQVCDPRPGVVVFFEGSPKWRAIVT